MKISKQEIAINPEIEVQGIGEKMLLQIFRDQILTQLLYVLYYQCIKLKQG